MSTGIKIIKNSEYFHKLDIMMLLSLAIMILFMLVTMIFFFWLFKSKKNIMKKLATVFAATISPIVACLSFCDKNTIIKILVIVLSVIECIFIFICNFFYLSESVKKIKILSINNKSSRKNSEKVIDRYVGKNKYDFSNDDIINNTVLEKIGKDIYSDVYETSEKMINFLEVAYDKYLDNIGINIWINETTELNIDESSKWHILFRRNTNADLPIDKIVSSDISALKLIKDSPGLIFFENKRKAFLLNNYDVMPREINEIKNNNIKRLLDKSIQNSNPKRALTGTICLKLQKNIISKNLKGSIFCQNISITLNNQNKSIHLLLFVTSYKESLCKRVEKEEISDLLECYGYEIKSIIAKHVFKEPSIFFYTEKVGT